MLFGHNCSHTVIGLLQLCTARSKEIDKLFGEILPAARPQTAALSTSKDKAIVVIGHKIHICLGYMYPIYKEKTACQRF